MLMARGIVRMVRPAAVAKGERASKGAGNRGAATAKAEEREGAEAAAAGANGEAPGRACSPNASRNAPRSRYGAPGVDAPEMDAPGMEAPGMVAPEMDAPGMVAPEMEALGAHARLPGLRRGLAAPPPPSVPPAPPSVSPPSA